MSLLPLLPTFLPFPTADGTTCAQKKLWGQCSQSWMAQAGWCALTCGRCSQPAATQGAASSGCTDVAPPGGFSCVQQKAWGKVRWQPCNMPCGWACRHACFQFCRCCFLSCATPLTPSPHSQLTTHPLLAIVRSAPRPGFRMAASVRPPAASAPPPPPAPTTRPPAASPAHSRRRGARCVGLAGVRVRGSTRDRVVHH